MSAIDSTYYSSYMVPWISDTTSGRAFGALNLFWNQGLLDIEARMGMGQVPLFTTYFNSYPNQFYGFNLDPASYYNNFQQTAMFSNLGNIGANSNWTGIPNMGLNNSYTPGSNPSNPTPANPAEQTYQKKHNRLLGFLKQLNDYAKSEDGINILTSAQKDELQTLVTSSSSKTYEEKYGYLKIFYDKLDKGILKKFLTKGSNGLSVNGESNGTKLLDKIENIGYEDESGIIDQTDAISKLHEQLKKINKEDTNLALAMPATKLSEDDKNAYTALDIISSYNSKYTKDHLITLYLDARKKGNADTVKSQFKPLIDALVREAKAAASKVDEKSEKAINDMADELSKDYENNSTNLKQSFDKVYVMTRIASAKALEKQLKETYDFDSELFNFISVDTKEDLENEGLKTTYDNVIKNINIEKDDNDDNAKTTPNIDELDDAEKINALINNAQLEKRGEFTVDGEKKIIYREKAKTDGRNLERKFIMGDDGMFIEVERTAPGSNEWKTTNNKVKASEIEKAVNDAKKAEAKKTAEAKKIEEDNAMANDTEPEKQEGSTAMSGKDVYTNLKGNTTNTTVYKLVNDRLGDLTEYDIIEFLDSYYKESGYKGKDRQEGIVEQLDDEYDGGRIKMENKRKMIQMLLDKARSLDLENTMEYKNIEDTLESYQEKFGDKTNCFQKRVPNRWWGRVVCRMRACEWLDRNMYALYNKIKEAEKTNK